MDVLKFPASPAASVSPASNVISAHCRAGLEDEGGCSKASRAIGSYQTLTGGWCPTPWLDTGPQIYAFQTVEGVGPLGQCPCGLTFPAV